MSIPIDDKRKYLERRLEFINLSKEVGLILAEFNIKLNFSGFLETFHEYIQSESSDIVISNRLVKEINFWINYMGQVQTIVKYYSNYFLIIAESENDSEKARNAHQKHFILKNYEKSIHVYKMRFRNSRRDCIEKTKESYKSFYRET